jgi:hypothetical protein
VRAVVLNHTTHAHLRCAFEEAFSHQRISLGDARERAGHGQDAVVNALDNFADSGFDTSLLAQVGDVLAGLANDDPGFLGRDNGTEGQLRLGIFFLGLGSLVLSITNIKLVHGIGETGLVDVVSGRQRLCRGHGEGCSLVVQTRTRSVGEVVIAEARRGEADVRKAGDDADEVAGRDEEKQRMEGWRV